MAPTWPESPCFLVLEPLVEIEPVKLRCGQTVEPSALAEWGKGSVSVGAIELMAPIDKNCRLKRGWDW